MSRRTVKRWAGHGVEELRSRWDREEIYLYGAIDSTNSAARDLAEAEAPAGAIVLCREQSAGRGRGDRRWVSPPDAGLYLSMIFRPRGVVRPPMVSILAGLGIVWQLDRAFPDLGPSLKWPNDLMVGSKKLGGILGEGSWGEAGPNYLVVGVGINVAASISSALPSKLRSRATWLQERVPDAKPIDAADAVIRGLEEHLHRPPRSLDGPTLDLLDEYDWLKNRRVRVHSTDGERVAVPGVCVGIAPDGALLFRPDRGALQRVDTGQVEVSEP